VMIADGTQRLALRYNEIIVGDDSGMGPYTRISDTELGLYQGGEKKLRILSDSIMVGQSDAGRSNVYIDNGSVQIRVANDTFLNASISGLVVGQLATSGATPVPLPNLLIAADKLLFRTGTSVTGPIQLNADGSGFVGNSNVSWNT
ncbi:hypothetical protein ACU8YE_25550, partial [Ralstonia sp. VS2407]